MHEGRRGEADNISVTLSIGCAALPSDQLHGRASHRLVAMADEAMYLAKRGGGNRVELTGAPAKRAA
jgi:GGDEF domain-containing protein